MKGGTIEIQKQKVAAPCGLYYCGACSIRIAHRGENFKLKGRLPVAYNVRPEKIRCEGCLSDDVFLYCGICPIKACVSGKGLEGC